ncbi:MAG: arylesterase [Chromatiales bacterium]|nr:arylesterase [Chromatiales bacterium]
MVKRLHSLLFALLLAAILVGCSDGPKLPPLAENAVILAFGDSLTYGTGTTRELSYPAILQQLSGRRVVNAGIPGEQTSGGLARLNYVLDEVEPQLMILCLGGNDMLRKKDLQLAAENLQKMVEISREKGVPVLLLGVPRPALFGMESAEFYHELAETLSLPLEADIIPEVLSDKELKSDQIHPNAEGYRLVAEAIYKKLQKSGAL